MQKTERQTPLNLKRVYVTETGRIEKALAMQYIGPCNVRMGILCGHIIYSAQLSLRLTLFDDPVDRRNVHNFNSEFTSA